MNQLLGVMTLLVSLNAVAVLATGYGSYHEPPIVKVIHKTVHIPKAVPVPKVIHVPKMVPVPKTVAVPHPVYVPVKVPIYKTVKKVIPIPKTIPVPKPIPVPVPKPVPVPVPIIKHQPVPVYKTVAIAKPYRIPYPVKVPKYVPYPIPKVVHVPKPYPVPVKVPIYKQVIVKKPVHIPVPVYIKKKPVYHPPSYAYDEYAAKAAASNVHEDKILPPNSSQLIGHGSQPEPSLLPSEPNYTIRVEGSKMVDHSHPESSPDQSISMVSYDNHPTSGYTTHTHYYMQSQPTYHHISAYPYPNNHFQSGLNTGQEQSPNGSINDLNETNESSQNQPEDNAIGSDQTLRSSK